MIRDPKDWEKLDERELVQQIEIMKRAFETVGEINRPMKFALSSALKHAISILKHKKLRFVDAAV